MPDLELHACGVVLDLRYILVPTRPGREAVQSGDTSCEDLGAEHRKAGMRAKHNDSSHSA